MRTATAKAFLTLGGVPIAVHSLRALSRVREIHSIVCVISADRQAQGAEMLQHYGPWQPPVQLACGGLERQDSVAAGLAQVGGGSDLVLVHDAARPFVSVDAVRACIQTAAAAGAAILAVPACDTLKLVDAGVTVVNTIDRRKVWLAQTPQVFRVGLLRRAYEQAQRDGYVGTDDAALVERIHTPVRIVPGTPTNRKITTPADLRWAEWYLETQGVPGSC